MDAADLKDLLDVAPQLSGEHVAKLTSRFVRIPSVNGQHSERDLALLIADELAGSGYQTTLVGSPDRPSLAAAGPGEPRVLLNGHLDTVPVDDDQDWRFDPYEGVIAGGAVHGRGACDMKGGLAIQVAVAQWLAAQGSADGLVLHFAMGEERGEPGTEDLIASGFAAPIGLVLEPTDFSVGVAQRGLMTIRITIEGRAGHASRPDLAENPISRLPAILDLIDGLEANPTSSHPLLGTPTWTVTGISSGVIPSMIPGQTEVLVDRRMIPGETVDSVLAILRNTIAERVSGTHTSVSVVEEEGIYDPAEIPSDARAVELMSDSLGILAEEVKLFGTPYSSDIRHLINTAGVEAITFGPGRFSEMHARDEFILIGDLQRGARSVAAFTALAIANTG